MWVVGKVRRGNLGPVDWIAGLVLESFGASLGICVEEQAAENNCPTKEEADHFKIFCISNL